MARKPGRKSRANGKDRGRKTLDTLASEGDRTIEGEVLAAAKEHLDDIDVPEGFKPPAFMERQHGNIRLRSITALRTEMARVYRATVTAEISVDLGTRLIYMLDKQVKAWELQRKLEIEGAADDDDRPAFTGMRITVVGEATDVPTQGGKS